MNKILIIEDDDYFRYLLEQMLKTGDYEICSARDGKEGCEMAAEVKPDVVITDIWMPRREGIETVRRIRQMLPATRIVVMSGLPVLANVSMFKIAHEHGADAAILKPFTTDEIHTLVGELLQGLRNTATNGTPLYR